MRFVREKYNYRWYNQVSPEFDLVGINNTCPLLAIAAYQVSGQWNQFWILRLEVEDGLPVYKRQPQLGLYSDLKEVCTAIYEEIDKQNKNPTDHGYKICGEIGKVLF